MRKRIAVLLAGVMVCSMLTACGSTEEPKEEPEAKQEETKEEKPESKEEKRAGSGNRRKVRRRFY